MLNRKIKNATKTEFDGQGFDSKLEVSIYKELTRRGYAVTREPKIILLEGWRSSIPFFDGLHKTPTRKIGDKVRDWSYSPDFLINHQGKDIYIEAKGMPNDTYPLKTKMFRKVLESKENPTEFWVVRTLTQLKKLLDGEL